MEVAVETRLNRKVGLTLPLPDDLSWVIDLLLSLVFLVLGLLLIDWNPHLSALRTSNCTMDFPRLPTYKFRIVGHNLPDCVSQYLT